MANAGRLEGHAQGIVVRAEDIERVLAQVPENKWWFDVPIEDNGASVDIPVEVPMRARREIVAWVLAIAG